MTQHVGAVSSMSQTGAQKLEGRVNFIISNVILLLCHLPRFSLHL